MSETTYQVTEFTSPYGSTRYKVTRTDGKATYSQDYGRRDTAEIEAEYLNSVPAGYSIRYGLYRSGTMKAGTGYWQISGNTAGDPASIDHRWDDNQPVPDNWPEGTRPLDVLISITRRHAEGAQKRIAAKAEADAVEAAETAVREARAEHLAEIQRTRGPLATPAQVRYILDLLERRRISGEGGGFFSGPTTEAGIEELTKNEASMYIRSLKGDY